VLAEKALGLPALLKSATAQVNLIENASADMWGNLSDQRSSYRRAIRSPSRLHALVTLSFCSLTTRLPRSTNSLV
jgi:hypothetical protein